MRVAGRLLGQRRQFPRPCLVPWFAFTAASCISCRRPSGAPESPALSRAGSPGGLLLLLPAPSGGQSRLLPPSHLCSWPWQRSDRAGKACGPHHSSTGVCVCTGVCVWSPHEQPSSCPDLGPVCCEGPSSRPPAWFLRPALCPRGRWPFPGRVAGLRPRPGLALSSGTANRRVVLGGSFRLALVRGSAVGHWPSGQFFHTQGPSERVGWCLPSGVP